MINWMYLTMNSRNFKGFSIIELGVVLAILGIVFGGVFSGFGEIRSVAKQLESESTQKEIKKQLMKFAMVNKYLPCPDTDATIDGMENRTAVVVGTDIWNVCNADFGAFWTDLKSEGFIKGTAAAGGAASDSGPIHALDGTFIANGGGAATDEPFTKNYICATNIENSIAQGMDTKLDDGVSNAGIVRTSDANGAAVPANAAELDATYAGGTTASVICKEL